MVNLILSLVTDFDLHLENAECYLLIIVSMPFNIVSTYQPAGDQPQLLQS